MKKLFLASYFVFVSDLLLPLLPKKPSELKLAFIPTAADPYSDKSWMDADRNKLISMGFQVEDLDIKGKTKEHLLEALKNIDVIFVSGGNTFYLLEKARKSGFDSVVKMLIEKGIVYVGSSAGSVLLCPTIEHVEDFDDKKDADISTYEGFSLIPFLILPHYGEKKYELKFKKAIDGWNKKYEVKLLTNKQVIVVNDTDIQVVSTL